jgi:hypothetical protein
MSLPRCERFWLGLETWSRIKSLPFPAVDTNAHLFRFGLRSMEASMNMDWTPGLPDGIFSYVPKFPITIYLESLAVENFSMFFYI